MLEMDKTIYSFLRGVEKSMVVSSYASVYKIPHQENTYLITTMLEERREYIKQENGIVIAAIRKNDRVYITFKILRDTHFHEIWRDLNAIASAPSLSQVLDTLRRLW